MTRGAKGVTMRYDFVPMPERQPLRWPNGARVAMLITPNLEWWDRTLDTTEVRHPGGASIIARQLPANVYDNPNWSWREYGLRVGVWRIFDVLDAAGVPASCSLTVKLGLERPEIVRAALERGWELVAHNYVATDMLTDFAFDPEGERAYLRQTLAAYQQVVGKPARGWFSSAFACTENTVDLLADEGLIFTMDYLNDEQPYVMHTTSGKRVVSVPYHVDSNDLRQFVLHGKDVDAVLKLYTEQFNELYRDGETSGRIMSIGVHPYVTGQPSKIRALRDFLAYAKQFPHVWWTTREELAEWYLAHVQVNS
jgi:allantoinase